MVTASVARPWSALRTPAFWLLFAANGLVALAVLLLGAVQLFVSPRAGALAAPAVLAYGALWLVLILRVGDPVERRPAWLVAAAVAWGGTVACAVAIGAEVFLDDIVAKTVSPTFAAQWGAALIAPTAEELAKAAGVVLVVLAARPYVTTVWSGAIYGALVGLGFAVVEDAGYALTFADLALPDDVVAAGQVLVLRFTTPGLVGHTIFSAVAGAGVTYAWLRVDRSRGNRLGVLAAAMAGSWLLHFTVNSPLAIGAAEALDTVGDAGEWAGYHLAVTLVAVPWLWWLVGLRRRDAVAVLDRAAALAPGAVTQAEVPALAGVRARWWADRAVRRAHGPEAAAAARRLRRVQLRLAATLAKPFRGYVAAQPPHWYAPPVRRWWHEAYEARQALAASGAPVDPDPVVRPRAAWWVGVALIVAAVAGLAYWPLSALALIGAVVAGWRWSGPRILTVGALAAVLVAYTWLVTALLVVIYPT
jgi:RsiW-degrading membrane proteinase PrsW (M82 family)